MTEQLVGTRDVVRRCPGCAAEYDASVGDVCPPCEIRLRPWCRFHSRKIGWLDGPVCPRCAPPREEVMAVRRRPDPDDLSGRIFAMLLLMLVMAVGGGLMGIATGYLYLSYGRGTVPETPLQFGKAGVIVGLVLGFVMYGRYVAALSGEAPPAPRPLAPPAPDPAPSPRHDPTPSPRHDPTPSPRPDPSAAASFRPAATRPDSLSRKPTQWPGGRSAREILRGPPKSLAELGIPETLPPPQAVDVVSLGCGGAVFGMLAGWVVASVAGAAAAGASLVGATVMGLGGLFVGIIRYLAIQRACEAEDEAEDDG
ncbi:MAG TPA: hypothetical protein VEQ60_08380 [Longimicrobium sp.]|nr:hypothetical protein [Longimicrobium sp.]